MPIYPEEISTSGNSRVADPRTGRTYTIIGWAHLKTGDVQAILIPDSLSPGEPLKFTANGPLSPEGA